MKELDNSTEWKKLAKDGIEEALFVPPVANFEAASPLALDDDLAVPLTQFDLAHVTASGIDLLRDQVRALWASASLASRYVPARIDANGRRRGVEIGLKDNWRIALPPSWRRYLSFGAHATMAPHERQ
jgi:hypothetical protein